MTNVRLRVLRPSTTPLRGSPKDDKGEIGQLNLPSPRLTKGALVAVRRHVRRTFVQKTGFRIRRWYRRKCARSLGKIEAIEDAGGTRVGKAPRPGTDRRKVENLLDEFENAAVFVLCVRNVSGLCVG